MAFNDGLDFARSYYLATATPFASLPALTEEIEADLVVVGGGAPAFPPPCTPRRRGPGWRCWRAAASAGALRGATAARSSRACARARAGLVKRLSGESGRSALFDLAVERPRPGRSASSPTHAIDCDLKTHRPPARRCEGRLTLPRDGGRSPLPARGHGYGRTLTLLDAGRPGHGRRRRPTMAASSTSAAATSIR